MENFSMMFSRKGYGRIYVRTEEDVQALKNIIKEMDDYEYSYMPEDLITVFSEENFTSTYVHKFCDLDMGKVLKAAWSKGIYCFVVFGKTEEEYF